MTHNGTEGVCEFRSAEKNQGCCFYLVWSHLPNKISSMSGKAKASGMANSQMLSVLLHGQASTCFLGFSLCIYSAVSFSKFLKASSKAKINILLDYQSEPTY